MGSGENGAAYFRLGIGELVGRRYCEQLRSLVMAMPFFFVLSKVLHLELRRETHPEGMARLQDAIAKCHL